MIVLICNSGSTSLKFKLFNMPSETVLASGGVERVGSEDDAIFHFVNCSTGYREDLNCISVPDYRKGIELFLDKLTASGVIENIGTIERVGFKTVLSKTCSKVSELNDTVTDGMKEWEALAPVHCRAYIQSIQAMKSVLPGAVMVGAFETAFHSTIPEERRIYGIPYEWTEKYGIKRLGFHGASHSYIAQVLSSENRHYRAISCHLGGSSSVCAILDGKSVDTSLGMSMETGLIHSCRTGDMDPTIVFFLQQCGLEKSQILKGLQENGGLKGISGVSGDLRYIQKEAETGNERAKLAIEVYVTGIVHYIGAFAMDLGGLDTLVFTAGIGEHSPLIREKVCSRLTALGVGIDDSRNESGSEIISSENSRVVVRVIHTDEEIIVARNTYMFQNGVTH